VVGVFLALASAAADESVCVEVFECSAGGLCGVADCFGDRVGVEVVLCVEYAEHGEP
jgi:hypothetical protein